MWSYWWSYMMMFRCRFLWDLSLFCFRLLFLPQKPRLSWEFVERPFEDLQSFWNGKTVILLSVVHFRRSYFSFYSMNVYVSRACVSVGVPAPSCVFVFFSVSVFVSACIRVRYYLYLRYSMRVFMSFRACISGCRRLTCNAVTPGLQLVFDEWNEKRLNERASTFWNILMFNVNRPISESLRYPLTDSSTIS